MGISASTKLLFGITKRLLYMVNSEAGKKNIESDFLKSAYKARVLFKPTCVHSVNAEGSL